MTFYCSTCRKYKPLASKVRTVTGKGKRIVRYRCQECVNAVARSTPADREAFGKRVATANKEKTLRHYDELREVRKQTT